MTTYKHMTASEANAMTQRADPDWHVAEILKGVKKQAEIGKFTLKSYACDFGSGNLYGGKPSDLQQAVIDKLKELGYTVEIRVEERQFVDIWLEVGWGAA